MLEKSVKCPSNLKRRILQHINSILKFGAVVIHLQGRHFIISLNRMHTESGIRILHFINIHDQGFVFIDLFLIARLPKTIFKLNFRPAIDVFEKILPFIYRTLSILAPRRQF